MRTTYPETPLATSASAALLVIIGAIQLAYGTLSAAALLHDNYEKWAGALYPLALAALGGIAVRAGFRLYHLAGWARLFGIGMGALLLADTWRILHVVRSLPQPSTGDGAEIIVLTPFTFLPGLWLTAYLLLPGVARLFRHTRFRDNGNHA